MYRNTTVANDDLFVLESIGSTTVLSYCRIPSPSYSLPLLMNECPQWEDIDVTYCPTQIPTSNPTTNPTIQPTIDPTIPPTNTPSLLPTKSYIISSTIYDIITENRTDTASVLTTREDYYSDTKSAKDLTDDLNDQFETALIALLIVFSISLILGYLHSRYVSINHFFGLGSLISVVLNIMDMISDLFFTVQAEILRDFNEPSTEIIFVLSCCFLVIPVILSVIQLWHQMHKHWLKNDKLRHWLSEYNKYLFAASIVSGSSFSAIDLFNSNLLSLEVFDMGLSKQDYLSFRYKRVYSLTLLENVPQLILQVWYIRELYGFENVIIVASLIFTSISILVSILSMFVTKQILYDQDAVIIEYDVKGKVIVEKNKNVNRKWILQEQLSTILGLEKQLISVERPSKIPGGMRVCLYIHINVTDNIRKKKDLEELIRKSMLNGQLAQTMNEAWDLQSELEIFNLNVSVRNSKKKMRESNENELAESVDVNNVEMVPLDENQPGLDFEKDGNGAMTFNGVEIDIEIEDDEGDAIVTEGDVITNMNDINMEEDEFVIENNDNENENNEDDEAKDDEIGNETAIKPKEAMKNTVGGVSVIDAALQDDNNSDEEVIDEINETPQTDDDDVDTKGFIE